MSEIIPKYSRIKAMAIAAGGCIFEEFEAMHSAAEICEQYERMLADIARRMAGFSHVDTDHEAMSPASKSGAANIRHVRGSNPNPVETVSNLELSYRLLKAAALGEDELQAAKKEIIRVNGWSRQKDRKRRVGGLLACTMGGFRGEFVRRATVGLDRSARKTLLEELAATYSKIMDTNVTVAMLRAEAKAAVVADEARGRKISAALQAAK